MAFCIRNGEVIFTKYNGNITEVMIPETINGVPVTKQSNVYTDYAYVTCTTTPKRIYDEHWVEDHVIDINEQ